MGTDELTAYQQITALLPLLSEDEQISLQKWLMDNPNISLQDLIEGKEKKGVFCPECGAVTTVVKYGKSAKCIQRYHCRQCKVTFASLSYTFLTN